jgi:hypothetical protein
MIYGDVHRRSFPVSGRKTRDFGVAADDAEVIEPP